MSYLSDVLAYTTFAHYRMGEASGLFQDSSSNARHTTSGSGATYGVTGAIVGDSDKAATFSGQEYQYVAGGADATRTLIAWVKTTATTGTIAGTYFSGNGSSYFDLRLNGSGAPQAQVNTVNVSGPTAINDGQWHMLAMTYDSGTNTTTLYVDGASAGSVGGATIQSLSDRIFLGGRFADYVGTLDEVSFLTPVLTGAQIAALYASGRSNDLFAGALDITLTGGTYTSPAIAQGSAGPQETALGESASPWNRSLWWKYTAPAGGALLDLDTELGASAETGLFVYTGSALNALTLIANDDDSGNVGGTSKLTGIQIGAGVTIRIAVCSYQGYASADTVLRVTRTGGFSFPDNFASAEEVVIATNGGTFTSAAIANTNATMETGEPMPTGFTSGKTLWWKYTPASSGTATFDLSLGTSDPEMAVYTGSAVNALTKIASDSDSGAGNTSLISNLAVTGGTTYYVQVGAYQNGVYPYQLQVTGPATASSGGGSAAAAGGLSFGGIAGGSASASGAGSLSLSGAFLVAVPTVPWIGATPIVNTGGRWWTGLGGAAEPQVKLLGRASRSSTAQPLTVVLGGAPRSATGSLSLSGSAIARAGGSASGGLDLSGAGAGRGRGIAAGGLSLSGAAVAGARAVGTGALTLSAAGTAGAVRAAVASGSLTLSGSSNAQALFPNDFINAQHVAIPTDGATYTSNPINNAAATLEAGEPIRDGYDFEGSLWWWYAPATSGLATFDLELSTGTATALAIYTGGRVDSLTEVAFDVYSAANNMAKITNLPVVGGQVYRIQVTTLVGGSAVVQPQVTGPATFPVGTIPIGRASRSSIAREIAAPLDYYPVEILRDSPEIYWRLEAQGDAIDYSGNERTGQFNNWEYYDEFTDTDFLMGNQVVLDGALGNGLRFVACEVYYSDPDDFAQTNDFTMEIWFQTEAGAPGAFQSGVTTVVMPIVTVGGNPGRSIGARGDNFYGRWGQTSGTNNSTNYPAMAPFSLVNDGDWHMLTFTKQGSIVRFYVDGVQTYENLAATTYAQPAASEAWISSSWGRERSYQPANAQFDEFSYFPTALSPTKIQRHYDSYDQLGDPPLHQTIPIGQASRTSLARSLIAAQARVIGFGRASRSSTARPLTVVQGVAPGTPQFVPIGRATRTSTARSIFRKFDQVVALGRAIRQSTSRTLAYVTGVLYADSFNRPAPVGTPDAGGPYSYPASVSTYFTIVDGALRSTINSTAWITTPVGSQIDATFTIKTVGLNGDFLFRYLSLAQYWRVHWDVTEGLSLICQFNNSTSARIGEVLALGAGDVVRVVARGRIIYVYLNGRLVLEAEDLLATQGTGVGFKFTNDQISLINDVFVRSLLPEETEVMDLLDQELALILSEGDHDAFIYRGRDSLVADEGLMA